MLKRLIFSAGLVLLTTATSQGQTPGELPPPGYNVPALTAPAPRSYQPEVNVPPAQANPQAGVLTEKSTLPQPYVPTEQTILPKPAAPTPGFNVPQAYVPAQQAQQGNPTQDPTIGNSMIVIDTPDWLPGHNKGTTSQGVPCTDCPPEDPTKTKYPIIKLTGFFQADYGLFGQSPNNIRSVGDAQDGADFRRTRLAAMGNVTENVNYMIEMDFAFPGRPSFMDVYMGISDLPVVGNFRIGQWRQPFGMDGQTSVRELTFLERGLPFAFLPFRQIGAGFFDTAMDERMTWAISGFRFPTDVFGGNTGDNGGYAMAARATFLPIYDNNGQQLVHVGGGFSYGDPSDNLVRYRNQPEFFVGETGGGNISPASLNTPFFVDTGPINTHNFALLNGELGANYNSLYFQSELYYTHVSQIGGPNLGFTGGYAQVGYFLTGEVRAYNKKAGVFGRVTPLNNFDCSKGGWGAFEVAGRISYLDLNSNNIRGGNLTDLTFGLNWFLNRNAKFQFNYIHAALDNPNFGSSDANIIAFRTQVDF